MRLLLDRLRSRDERGYVALLVALLLGTVLFGLAAIGVDTARWYLEVERLQKAADASALAGVTYMPADLSKARLTALATARMNGYPNGGRTVITVAQGARPSQLRVTITTTIDNSFGAAIGSPSATLTRSAVADFTAPAPMGSPCNTFGNEPPSQLGAALPTGTALPTTPFVNCSAAPKFWAAIEGPATDKVQGDRYMTVPCTAASTYACISGQNDEFRPEGYFFAVHVEPLAVGTPIDFQVYDPAYVSSSVNCAAMGATSGFSNDLAGSALNSMNDYTSTDGVARYDDVTSVYCSGDYNPGGVSGAAPDTTFVLREQTDTNDPMKGAVISGCTKQFRGTSVTPTNVVLSQWTNILHTNQRSTYNPQLARVFHQWVSLCTFTPTRSGDYYLQVRTNVAPGGVATANVNAKGTTFNPIVYSDNPAAGAAIGNTGAGIGLNSFAMRAVPANSLMRSQVSVAGFARMPILQNASSSTARFNLIRALPATKGQYVGFDFYDAADGSTSPGSVRVIAPVDATGSIKTASNIPGCKGALNGASYSNLTNCTVTVQNTTHNGQLQHMIIPLPADYSCNPATLGGCWFQVEVTFSGNVTDFTTWDSNIGGDPVRLIE